MCAWISLSYVHVSCNHITSYLEIASLCSTSSTKLPCDSLPWEHAPNLISCALRQNYYSRNLAMHLWDGQSSSKIVLKLYKEVHASKMHYKWHYVFLYCANYDQDYCFTNFITERLMDEDSGEYHIWGCKGMLSAKLLGEYWHTCHHSAHHITYYDYKLLVGYNHIIVNRVTL